MDQTAKMPFGLCLMIWTALAVAGWGAFDVAFRFDLSLRARLIRLRRMIQKTAEHP